MGQIRRQKLGPTQSAAFLFPFFPSLFLSSPTVTASVSYWARRCCPLPGIQSAGNHGCVHGRLVARHHTWCTLTQRLYSHLHTSQSEPEYLLCKCMFNRKLPCGAQSKTKNKKIQQSNDTHTKKIRIHNRHFVLLSPTYFRIRIFTGPSACLPGNCLAVQSFYIYIIK